jgi:hypothetical protein
MSSVPAVLAALTTIGRNALPDSQVINGGLSSETVTLGRALLIGDEEILIQRDFDSMSDVTTSEQYMVPLATIADFPGSDQLLADAAAFADYEAIVQAILDHPSGHTLGLSASGVISALPLGEHRFLRASDRTGVHAMVRFGVQVYAQTT